jgi:hypothetical protein
MDFSNIIGAANMTASMTSNQMLLNAMRAEVIHPQPGERPRVDWDGPVFLIAALLFLVFVGYQPLKMVLPR